LFLLLDLRGLARLAGGVLEDGLENMRAGNRCHTISLIILTASPIELAWNPMLFIPLIKSFTVMSRPANLLKSSSSTFWEPSGISFEGTRTASVTEEGSAPCSEFAVMLNMI